MATTTKQNNQYCTTSPSIDANIGPWSSIAAYIAWLSSELGVDAPLEGTEILVKDSTGKMTKYRYEIISGEAGWTNTASGIEVDSAINPNSTKPVQSAAVADALNNMQSDIDSAIATADGASTSAAASASSALSASSSASDAAASAERAADALEEIKQAINDLDPSQSAEQAITALAAQVASQGASISDLESSKVTFVDVHSKNLFNKRMSRSVVTESTQSTTGYIITHSDGTSEEFASATQAATQLTDDKPDENIIGAYFHRYFGWIYDSGLFTSHKIPIGSPAVTGTFFNGGIEKSILAFDEDGQFLGFVVTDSNDWAHVTLLASSFEGISYVRLSNCVVSADMDVAQLENGTTPTSYEPYYSGRYISKDELPSDSVYLGDLAKNADNKGSARIVLSGIIDIVQGYYDANGRPVIGSGNTYISDYVEIYGGLVYEFGYVNACRFYDAEHNEIQGTALSAGFSYQSPSNARYMSVHFNGPVAIQFTSVLPENYVESERDSNLKNLVDSERRSVCAVGTKTHRSSYIIGDSEASNFHHYVDAIRKGTIVSSFGGHKTDLIATNVLQGTGGIGSLSHIKDCNVIVVAGTNDAAAGQNRRLVAYHRELIHRLRAAGAREIFAISPFWDITQDIASMQQNGFITMIKRLYGGHYIDVMQHIIDCGVYYNPYHPSAFVQPSVEGSVTISFEDVSALVECGMIAAGQNFYIRYYDDKADLYQCATYNTGANTITATLVENGSDVRPGGTAGVYSEGVTTPAWSGTKQTLGWVYNEEDGSRIESGQIPACIYADRSVHFGKIIARIIEDMLGLYYGVVEN